MPFSACELIAIPPFAAGYLVKLRMKATSCLLVFAACTACGAAPQRGPDSSDRASSAPKVNGDWFADRAKESGLDFTHVNGMSGKFYYAEIIAPGAAMFDYDNDGDLDIYLVQGRPLGAAITPAGSPPLKGRLFRNDLVVNPDGTRTLRFTDVTDASGINASGYGMGVATGDFNNDGCVDLYLTNLGRQSVVPQQLRRHVHRRLEAEPHRPSRAELGRHSSWSVSACVPGLRPRRMARPVRRQLSQLARRIQHAVLQSVWKARLLLAQRLPAAAEPPLSQQSRRHVHGCHRCGGNRARLRTGARRLDGRLQRRRLDRHLRRQRRPAEPAVDQSARRHVQEHRACCRARR